jgi:transposase-like protein
MKAITPQGAVQQMESLVDEAVNFRCYEALSEARQLVTALANALDDVLDITVNDATERHDYKLAEMVLRAAKDHGVAWTVEEVRG